jgi:hypothetical protein
MPDEILPSIPVDTGPPEDVWQRRMAESAAQACRRDQEALRSARTPEAGPRSRIVQRPAVVAAAPHARRHP